MIRPFQIVGALTLFLGGALLTTVPAAAQQANQPRTVRVGGEATVSVPPDQATVRFGIVSQAKTAEQARSQNAEAAKNAMNAVRELGVPQEKMRMETLRLQPRREYNPQTKRHEEKGYEATRQVVVELADLEQLPRLVTRVVQRGANRLEGINYELSDRLTTRNEALRKAAMDARDKARLLATSLDATLGPVRQITEEDFGYEEPQPRVQMSYAKAADTEAAPEPDAYAAGEITVRVRVQIVFDLADE
ncbi:MAG TPA: SIMPL domain-containing protein [Salinibacter sp.]|nr:SIMPL domain-containing protein [Salinibacter sp.]